MSKKVMLGLVPTTGTWKIVGLCILLLLITTASLVACSGPTSTATLTSPAPTLFQTAELAINPAEVNPGVEVIITAQVTNTDDTEDTYTAGLRVNDVTMETMEVTMAAGESKPLSFIRIHGYPGDL